MPKPSKRRFEQFGAKIGEDVVVDLAGIWGFIVVRSNLQLFVVRRRLVVTDED
jgi:hypothetical protein